MYQTLPDQICFQLIYSVVIFNHKQNNVTIYFQEHLAFFYYAHYFYYFTVCQNLYQFHIIQVKILQNIINTNHLLHQSLIK